MPVEAAAKALAIWAAILGLAIANGALREAVLIPKLGNATGLILSGVLLSLPILATAYISLPWLQVRTFGALLLIGLGWLALTLAFEFSFGLLRGKPMAEILEAYTFKGGNIWPLVLVVTALAPVATGKIRGWL